MFMVCRSWLRQHRSVIVDQAGNFCHGSFDISSIPMNKNVEIHMERTKVLPSS